MTHKEKVLALLSDGLPHTHMEGYRLGVMLHSRAADLRRDGHDIRVTRDGDDYLYRLVGGPLVEAGVAHSAQHVAPVSTSGRLRQESSSRVPASLLEPVAQISTSGKPLTERGYRDEGNRPHEEARGSNASGIASGSLPRSASGRSDGDPLSGPALDSTGQLVMDAPQFRKRQKAA